jgi:uncharacterized protein YyaL (SSP411 family)
MPSAHSFFITAIDFALGPTYEIIISGRSQSTDTLEMFTALRKNFIPNKSIILRPSEVARPPVDSLAEFAGAHSSKGDRATAYVCLNYACQTPTTDPAEMLRLLGVNK